MVSAADKTWLSIDVTFDKGLISCEAQGEYPSVTSLNKAEIPHPENDEISSDPEVAGFKRIPNLEERIKKMESKYILEIQSPVETEYEEVKPLRPETKHGTIRQ